MDDPNYFPENSTLWYGHCCRLAITSELAANSVADLLQTAELSWKHQITAPSDDWFQGYEWDDDLATCTTGLGSRWGKQVPSSVPCPIHLSHCLDCRGHDASCDRIRCVCEELRFL